MTDTTTWAERELAATTRILREHLAIDSKHMAHMAEFYVVCDLQISTRHHEDDPAADLTDAELGARVRMLLAALEAAKAAAQTETPAPVAYTHLQNGEWVNGRHIA
jgi:hypothetical protein